MKKYLIISVIFTLVISVFIYSVVYVPQINEYFKSLVSTTKNSNEENTESPVELKVNLEDTFPDLSIKNSESFKNVQFGDLRLKVSSDYKLSESSERINLKIDDKNEIIGFFYPLTSTPRKDIIPEEFQSNLLKNTYSLTKKSNIPDKFVQDVFSLGIGSEVKDSIGGEEITYNLTDLVTSKNYNTSGFYFNSDKEDRYKFILLSTKKLYIFNIKVEQSNYLKTIKTFYNLDLEE